MPLRLPRRASAGSRGNCCEATAADTGSTGGTDAQAEGSGAPPNGPVRIGSKDFTEAILVAELYAQVLERAGFTVERKFNLGATPIAHEALLKGDIDLYPEYTSTGLQEVLKDTNRYDDAAAILDAVRNGYEEQFQLTWLDASPFNNTNVFATTPAIAQQYGLKTISDLAAMPPNCGWAARPSSRTAWTRRGWTRRTAALCRSSRSSSRWAPARCATTRSRTAKST